MVTLLFWHCSTNPTNRNYPNEKTRQPRVGDELHPSRRERTGGNERSLHQCLLQKNSTGNHCVAVFPATIHTVENEPSLKTMLFDRLEGNQLRFEDNRPHRLTLKEQTRQKNCNPPDENRNQGPSEELKQPAYRGFLEKNEHCARVYRKEIPRHGLT